MKKLLNIFSILFSVIIITSCGGGEDGQGPQNPFTPEKYIISVTTSGQGKVLVNGTEITSILEFEKGESVKLEAIPAEGYYFEKWAKDGSEISINNPYETVIIADVIYTAVFKVKQQEKIKIDVTSTEGGSAKVNGNSSVEVEQGDNVSLSATPNEGYIFVNWTLDGKQISTEKEYDVRAIEDAIYVANFAKKDVKYVVSVEASEGGSAKVNGTSSVEVVAGTSVTLSATANSDYEFVNWTANGTEVSTEASCQIAISSNITYKANFKKIVKYTVSVEASEGGSAKVNGASSVEVVAGTSVTLSATANSDYEFVNWTANGTEVSTEASFQVAISSNITYKANFKKIVKYTVSVEASEGGSATVNGSSSAEVVAGTSVTLSATANSDYEFVNWTANGTEVSTEASCQIAISSNITYKANFKKKVVKYIVSVEAGVGGSATVNGSSSAEVVAGTSVTLSATANSDYEFVNWTANGTEVSKSASFQVTVNAAVTYKANFKKIETDPTDPDTPSTPNELINMVETQNMAGLAVTQLINCELWNAVMDYSNGITPENLKLSYGNLMPASNVSYEQIVDVFLARLNSITGESFRLPTSSEMNQIVSYITFASPVNYVWCSNYKDEVDLYSVGPDSPEIPVTPSTRLVFGKNSSVQSISMTYKNKTIGFVIVKE